VVKLKEGDVLAVPAEVKPGPFSGERMIGFDTIHGPISGFVSEDELKEVSGQWCVRAFVQSVDSDVLTVRIRGSFFTTNGIAKIDARTAIAA